MEFYLFIRIFVPVKLSIIIPVYRVEATLNRCVESVLNQNISDFEVILVDDGSPDQCPQMCDEWAEKDQRIKVIHKTNGGLSDARNAGIDMAQGNYLTFVDSDDYIAENTYMPLINMLCERPDIDILEYPVFVHYGSSTQHILSFKEGAEYKNMDDYWYTGKAYEHSYAWNKIYHTSLFTDIRYPVGVIFEDVHTLPLLLKLAKIVVTSNQGLYFYCKNDQGITSTADGCSLRMLLNPHVEIILSNIKRQDRAFQVYYLHVVNIQMDVYEFTGDMPVLPTLPIRSAYFSGVQKLKAIALNILGVNKLCVINKIIHHLWRNH